MRDHFRPFPRPIAVANVAGVLLAASDPAEVASTDEAVSKYLQQRDYRKNWKFLPDKQAFYKGVVPHDAVLTTYVNAPALKGLQTSGRLPVGSMIVMENDSPDRKL